MLARPSIIDPMMQKPQKSVHESHFHTITKYDAHDLSMLPDHDRLLRARTGNIKMKLVSLCMQHSLDENRLTKQEDETKSTAKGKTSKTPVISLCSRQIATSI